jgi:hypothetical protein
MELRELAAISDLALFEDLDRSALSREQSNRFLPFDHAVALRRSEFVHMLPCLHSPFQSRALLLRSTML